jgi:hypothetical protein
MTQVRDVIIFFDVILGEIEGQWQLQGKASYSWKRFTTSIVILFEFTF